MENRGKGAGRKAKAKKKILTQRAQRRPDRVGVNAGRRERHWPRIRADFRGLQGKQKARQDFEIRKWKIENRDKMHRSEDRPLQELKSKIGREVLRAQTRSLRLRSGQAGRLCSSHGYLTGLADVIKDRDRLIDRSIR